MNDERETDRIFLTTEDECSERDGMRKNEEYECNIHPMDSLYQKREERGIIKEVSRVHTDVISPPMKQCLSNLSGPW